MQPFWYLVGFEAIVLCGTGLLSWLVNDVLHIGFLGFLAGVVSFLAQYIMLAVSIFVMKEMALDGVSMSFSEMLGYALDTFSKKWKEGLAPWLIWFVLIPLGVALAGGMILIVVCGAALVGPAMSILGNSYFTPEDAILSLIFSLGAGSLLLFGIGLLVVIAILLICQFFNYYGISKMAVRYYPYLSQEGRPQDLTGLCVKAVFGYLGIFLLASIVCGLLSALIPPFGKISGTVTAVCTNAFVNIVVLAVLMKLKGISNINHAYQSEPAGSAFGSVMNAGSDQGASFVSGNAEALAQKTPAVPVDEVIAEEVIVEDLPPVPAGNFAGEKPDSSETNESDPV